MPVPVRSTPRCPACRKPALREPWTQAELVSAIALPGTRVKCVHCGAEVPITRETEWVRE